MENFNNFINSDKEELRNIFKLNKDSSKLRNIFERYFKETEENKLGLNSDWLLPKEKIYLSKFY